jgi:hypothetical protein
MTIPPPATLVVIVSLSEGTKKPRHLASGSPAISRRLKDPWLSAPVSQRVWLYRDNQFFLITA